MVLIFSVFIGIALDFADAKPADSAVKYYASKYDHIDVQAIVNNRRMVNYYSACLLSTGPCPPEGAEFKRILPEALLNNCGRCTEKQVSVAFHAIKRIKKEYPKVWSQLSEKWDPDDIYVKKFESTFAPRYAATKFSETQRKAVLSGFGKDDYDSDNIISGSFPSVTQTSHQNTTPRRVLITLTSTPPSSTTTKTITDYSYSSQEPISLVSTSTTKLSLPSKPVANSLSNSESPISTTFSTKTTRPPIIPGLIPINTFFTNPPIPVRPLANLNIGVNIGATVKAIREVERIVAGVAMEKLGFIRNMFLPPFRKTRRKYS